MQGVVGEWAGAERPMGLVVGALEVGADSSRSVAEELGIGVRLASAWLCKLRGWGLVEVAGWRYSATLAGVKGRRERVYRLVG